MKLVVRTQLIPWGMSLDNLKRQLESVRLA